MCSTGFIFAACMLPDSDAFALVDVMQYMHTARKMEWKLLNMLELTCLFKPETQPLMDVLVRKWTPSHTYNHICVGDMHIKTLPGPCYALSFHWLHVLWPGPSQMAA